MLKYMKTSQDDRLVTISEACELLGLTKEELRSKCEQYGVSLYNWDGEWGFPGEHFRCFNNTLYFEQCRDGYDDSRIFLDTPANRPGPSTIPQQDIPVLTYIQNIRGLSPTYTVAEASNLLGVTPDELEKACDENGLLIIRDWDGTWFITCYEYLTLNNILYHKQCAAFREGNPLA